MRYKFLACVMLGLMSSAALFTKKFLLENPVNAPAYDDYRVKRLASGTTYLVPASRSGLRAVETARSYDANPASVGSVTNRAILVARGDEPYFDRESTPANNDAQTDERISKQLGISEGGFLNDEPEAAEDEPAGIDAEAESTAAATASSTATATSTETTSAVAVGTATSTSTVATTTSVYPRETLAPTLTPTTPIQPPLPGPPLTAPVTASELPKTAGNAGETASMGQASTATATTAGTSTATATAAATATSAGASAATSTSTGTSSASTVSPLPPPSLSLPGTVPFTGHAPQAILAVSTALPVPAANSPNAAVSTFLNESGVTLAAMEAYYAASRPAGALLGSVAYWEWLAGVVATVRDFGASPLCDGARAFAKDKSGVTGRCLLRQGEADSVRSVDVEMTGVTLERCITDTSISTEGIFTYRVSPPPLKPAVPTRILPPKTKTGQAGAFVEADLTKVPSRPDTSFVCGVAYMSQAPAAVYEPSLTGATDPVGAVTPVGGGPGRERRLKEVVLNYAP